MKIYKIEEFEQVTMKLGDSFIGKFVMTKMLPCSLPGFPGVTAHYFVSDEMGPIYLFGSSQLNFGLYEVSPGQRVQVEYSGKEPSEWHPTAYVHAFRVVPAGAKKAKKRR